MSTDPPPQLTEIGDQDWSALLRATSHDFASPSSTTSPAQHCQDASPSSSAAERVSTSKQKQSEERKSPNASVANLLTLTELRKAAWARIYSDGIKTGDATISTTRQPTWKQFDSLMFKRHRYIAVDPRDNRTLGWVACFDPFPQWSALHEDDWDSEPMETEDGRQGRTAEIQVMVAEGERARGVGAILVNAVMSSLNSDSRFSVVQAGYFTDSAAAGRLFAKCGFQVVSTTSNAVKMLDGPKRGAWRNLVIVQARLPPLEHQTKRPRQSSPTPTPPAIDMTINPKAVHKRPRLD
ncbi:acetyltransferase [Pseudozyma hubeiensis SY62]|uniref:Acetyltransferase n=1 Tax=Pseudozyma hubeiensis (strain SY62) TaxID=1305764 RepID=R9P089_PSEHS|nr:acetyltransferase [Pseudozyma hubeiensis SY62]GAC94494.1 acetyltransferase [Pseudozyma hubeiensis SY62]